MNTCFGNILHAFPNICAVYFQSKYWLLKHSFCLDEVSDEEHNSKLYRYQDLLGTLPDVNYNSLRYLILHLNQ